MPVAYIFHISSRVQFTIPVSEYVFGIDHLHFTLRIAHLNILSTVDVAHRIYYNFL